MPFVGIGVGVGRQRFGGGGGGFDADYQAVLDYATTQGYTLPSASQQVLQNQLMLDLKSAGIWSKLDNFGVFATDGDSDFALINWKLLNDYTAVNSPTFTPDQGFTGNGTSSHINTGNALEFSGSNFQSSTQLGSFGAWSYFTKLAVGTPIAGANSSGNTLRGGNLKTIMGSSVGSNSNLIVGLYHNNNNAIVNAGFQNGVEITTGVSGSTQDLTTFYGLRDSSAFTADTISILFSGGDLSAEASDFYNACNTYISAL
jgi:hypothetical protein